MISFLNNIFKICFDHEWSWNTIRLCLQFSIMKSKTSTDLITILLYIIHKFYNFSLVIRRAQVPSWSIVMHPQRRIIGFWASYIRDHTMHILLFMLQATVDLPSVASFDPYTPRITLDSKAVTGSQAFAAVLKEHLLHMFQQPIEARLQMLKPGTCGTLETKTKEIQTVHVRQRMPN